MSFASPQPVRAGLRQRLHAVALQDRTATRCPSVQAPGYFDEAVDMLASGDMLLVSAPEGGKVVCVAAERGPAVHGAAGLGGPLQVGRCPPYGTTFRPGGAPASAQPSARSPPHAVRCRPPSPRTGHPPARRRSPGPSAAPGTGRPSSRRAARLHPPAAAGAGLTGSMFPDRVRPTCADQSAKPPAGKPARPSSGRPMTPAIASAFLPTLRRIDPERAHRLALRALRLGLAGRAPARTTRCSPPRCSASAAQPDRAGRRVRQGCGGRARLAAAWASAPSSWARSRRGRRRAIPGRGCSGWKTAR